MVHMLKLKCNQKCFNSHCERENINKMPKDVNGNNSKKQPENIMKKRNLRRKRNSLK